VVGKAKEQAVEVGEAVEAEEVVGASEVVLHQKSHLPLDAAPLAAEEMVQGAMAHP